MYHFHYFPACGWRVSIPKQQASAGRVAYRGGCEPTVVLDLHSHHEMNAYFSSTDNADEQGCRFYAVIGKIYSRPELRLRLGMYGDFVELDPCLLFDGSGPFEEAELGERYNCLV
jgi:PRTRC genetic system protein A